MDKKKAKSVFKTCDLIEKAVVEKGIFSAEVFYAIVHRAREGEIEAVRWLTEYDFISLRRHKPPVQVPADVLEDIEAVRKSKLVDMQNYREVIRLAEESRIPDTVQWLRAHESES